MSDNINIADSLLTWDQVKGSEESKLIVGVYILFIQLCNYVPVTFLHLAAYAHMLANLQVMHLATYIANYMHH